MIDKALLRWPVDRQYEESAEVFNAFQESTEKLL